LIHKSCAIDCFKHTKRCPYCRHDFQETYSQYISKKISETLDGFKREDFNFNCTDDGKTGLMIAIQNRQSEVVKKLLKLKVDLEIKDDHGNRAIHYAFDEDLLAENNETTKEYVRILPLLFERGVDPNSLDAHGKTIIHDSIIISYFDAFHLLENYPKTNWHTPDSSGYTPIAMCAMYDREYFLPAIIAQTTYSQIGNTIFGHSTLQVAAFSLAHFFDFRDFFNSLVEHSGDDCLCRVNIFGESELHTLVWMDKPDHLKYILNYQLNKGIEMSTYINMKDFSGQSPFFLACKLGYFQTMSVLFLYGADIYIANDHLITPKNIIEESKDSRLKNFYKRFEEIYIRK